MDAQAINNEIADILCGLIEIPSPSGGEDAAAGLLESVLSEKGFKPHRKHNNVWACLESGKNLPSVLLVSHIDTVKPVSGWTLDPYRATVRNGRVYGLGSNDAGASVVALLGCFLRLAGIRKLPYNLIFAAVAEEEISGGKGIASILDELGQVDLGIVGEPTGMKMAVAEKGLMVLDVTVSGKSAHAGHAAGVNAIYQAMKDVEWIRTFNFDQVSELLGPVQMQVTMINAGSQHNVVPDRCTYVVDVRGNECYTNRELYKIIREHVSGNVVPRSFRLNASSLPLDHPVVRKGISMGIGYFGSSTLSDKALLPFASIKMGPGESIRSHTADEFVELGEIQEGISTYVNLLNGLQL